MSENRNESARIEMPFSRCYRLSLGRVPFGIWMLDYQGSKNLDAICLRLRF